MALTGGGVVCKVALCDEKKSAPKITSPSERHMGGLKIWGTGMLKDPEGLSAQDRKRGKGVQHLNSDYWIQDLGTFIARNQDLLKAHLRHTEFASPEYEYRYYLNQSNMLFMKSLQKGLRSAEARELWLMASWCCLVAAEVDHYNYSKYTQEQRKETRRRFYGMYLKDTIVPPEDSPEKPQGGLLVAPSARIDLIPPVALERLSLHNELCCLLWSGSVHSWQVEGFPISKRIDSLKRHIDEAHHMEYEEDAIAHLIWNFMAIYHVLTLFPDMNDCPNYEQMRRSA